MEPLRRRTWSFLDIDETFAFLKDGKTLKK
jgi:hypothetical protein